jgi:hypothetical protein
MRLAVFNLLRDFKRQFDEGMQHLAGAIEEEYTLRWVNPLDLDVVIYYDGDTPPDKNSLAVKRIAGKVDPSRIEFRRCSFEEWVKVRNSCEVVSGWSLDDFHVSLDDGVMVDWYE